MSSSLWAFAAKLLVSAVLALKLTIGGGVAQPGFEAFFWAISTQESGGNYGAVGPAVQGGHHAYGKYQVMDYNVGPWTAQYYGKKLTPQQFLNNKQAQEAVARGKLKSYYNRYGAEGAAAMWYSGQSNPNKTYGNPPVYKYVDDVMGYASRYSGQSVSTYSGGGGGGAPVVPKLSEKELAEKYGFTMSFLNANPELKNIFKKMVSEGWTQDMFNAKLRGTKWWKTHSEKERQYLTQMYTDPATAKQSLSQAKITANQLAQQLGIKLTSFTKKKIDEAAYNVVAKGWNEGQLRYYLGQYVYFDGGDMEGQGADVQNELKSYAYSMGVTMSNSWYADNTRKVLRGIATVSDFKNDMLRQAKAQFPQYAKQLDAGQTVADIAQPYLQSMSQILELPTGSINLFDSTIKKALQYKNPGTLQNQVKPLWQFENELRADPRWKQTKNAQDSLMQVGHQVLADFGFRY